MTNTTTNLTTITNLFEAHGLLNIRTFFTGCARFDGPEAEVVYDRVGIIADLTYDDAYIHTDAIEATVLVRRDDAHTIVEDHNLGEPFGTGRDLVAEIAAGFVRLMKGGDQLALVVA